MMTVVVMMLMPDGSGDVGCSRDVDGSGESGTILLADCQWQERKQR